MQLETLTCNSCGAPLKVPDTANFVTCNHCSTQLAIRRTETATFTEGLGELTRKTEELAEQVARLTQQNQVASLDRDWQVERQRYMVTDKHGHQHLPSEFGAVFMGIVAAGFGLFWTISAASMGAPGFFPLFGLVFVAVGIITSVSSFVKAKDYRAAQRRYRRRRAQIAKQDVDVAGSLDEVNRIPTPDEYLRQLEGE